MSGGLDNKRGKVGESILLPTDKFSWMSVKITIEDDNDHAIIWIV